MTGSVGLKKKIREIIVVEGRHDESAVKRSFEAEVIITNGTHISTDDIERIRLAQARCGVIVLTDPDGPGEMIRRKIKACVPGCLHAHLPKKDAVAQNDIGVENARDAAIIRAIEQARRDNAGMQAAEFDIDRMKHWGLIGGEGSAVKRELLGDELGIGYSNAKQFLAKLNAYGIEIKEFEEAAEKLFGGNDCDN